MKRSIYNIVDEQLKILKKLGIDAQLCGSYKLEENNIHSDIDLQCFVKDPLESCYVVHKYYDYIYPYYIYNNLSNASEYLCNFKFYISNSTDPTKHYNFDLTFYPSHYKFIYTDIELFRRQFKRNYFSRKYMLLKKQIYKRIYLSTNPEERKFYGRQLQKLKSSYFDYYLHRYCDMNCISYYDIKRYFEFELQNVYVGKIKIR